MTTATDTIIVHGDHGEIIVDVATGKPFAFNDAEGDDDPYSRYGIILFDLDEYLSHYGELNSHIDILDIGYWFEQERAIKYEAADAEHRARMSPDAIIEQEETPLPSEHVMDTLYDVLIAGGNMGGDCDQDGNPVIEGKVYVDRMRLFLDGTFVDEVVAGPFDTCAEARAWVDDANPIDEDA